MTSSGVVYLLCGAGYAERLAVSIFTLRRHWDGPVLVFATDDDSEAVCRRIAEDGRLGVQVERREPLAHPRHGDYLTKTMVPAWSPFKRTVFLDADTAVVGPIEELFEAPLTLVQFSDWQSQGRTMRGRISGWLELDLPAVTGLVERMLATSWTAINTGVYGFHRGQEILRAWHRLSVVGQAQPLTDELAMQLLYPDAEGVKILNDAFNCSPFHGIHRAEARIWHFHGSKHLRKEAGRAIWEPLFREALAQDAGELDAWAGQFDRQVLALLSDTRR